jgi:hypothetical protein
VVAINHDAYHPIPFHEHCFRAGVADECCLSVNRGLLEDLVEKPSIDLDPQPGSVGILAVRRKVALIATLDPNSTVAFEPGL